MMNLSIIKWFYAELQIKDSESEKINNPLRIIG